MDIYSAPGTKVKFISKNGHKYQLEDAKLKFEHEEVLTVKFTVVHSSSSEVYFEEYPGCFNTVMFENVESDT